MIEWAAPSMSGRALQPGVEDALSDFGGHVQMLVDDLNLELDALRSVSIPGQGQVGIQQLFDGTAPWADALFVPSGFVGFFNGTLDAAYELNGWYVMDGRYTDDLLGKYIRASALGDDAGCTGGANTHTHDPASGAATESETIVTGAGQGSVCVCECAGGTAVSTYDHYHNMNPAGHAHDIGAAFSVDAGANEPAYWAGIPIQKI